MHTPTAVLDDRLVASQIKRDDKRPRAVRRGQQTGSQPRAVSRSAACCNCGSGGASATASLPRIWVCACNVSHVALHSS